MRPIPPYRVFLGWDAREMVAYNVAQMSLKVRASVPVIMERLALPTLQAQGLYTRPTREVGRGLWDEISGAPMSTGHAFARFWIPVLTNYTGVALFCDGDVLFRADVRELFALADERYAVQVVEHPPLLEEGEKKSGHIQQAYPRKNQSSVMLINCGHPSNAALTPDVLNTWPGRDLHAFKWLTDDLIGELPTRWNYLVGVNPPMADPALVHYTTGTPDLEGHDSDPFADEWFSVARMAGYKFNERVGR